MIPERPTKSVIGIVRFPCVVRETACVFYLPQKERGFEVNLEANTFAVYAPLGPTSFAVPTLF